ncbi:hypothetical protein C8J57DRAFT_1074290 [Mycena rebaudengoi]|nr:hypothetical protein C8J57DRAFT_1074290 [Mycena rebaudengoi]
MKPGASWFNPARNFVYSQGEPRGSTGKNLVFCDVLVDSRGNKVACKESHSTSDIVGLSRAHITASREDISQRLRNAQLDRERHSSTRSALFQKTLAYFVALMKQGCSAPPHEATDYFGEELEQRQAWLLQLQRNRRGHSPKTSCDGRLLFQYDNQGKAFIRCEHYHRKRNIDHLIDWDAGRGLYDINYLEALFLGDPDTIADFGEDGLALSDKGPFAVCSTVANFSSIKVNSNEHRNEDGDLVILEMQRLGCRSKFRIFEPVEECREECPWILVVCHGAHPHPIPLPTKTPPGVRTEILELLKLLNHDLPDLTPRRFLRHPTTDAFLHKRLPGLKNPTLLDLHSSLGNRDHIRAYILQAQESSFPKGTGWDGLQYMKQEQDRYLSSEYTYIRYMEEIPSLGMTYDPADDDDLDGSDHTVPFRIAVCMAKEGSRRLVKAKYLQSDIAFRRIVGFKEFELGGLERDSRTTIVYCRIFLNRQTAAAHELIFQKIHEIVFADTGENLTWRHLHSATIDGEVGILHFVLDQHGGQAKGLGLYLKSLSQELVGKYDLHEPHRPLPSLDEYDHLHRVIRLCTSHIFRNIRKVNVPEPVRNLMRSLVCIEHSDWENTIQRIQVEGGPAGANWIADKIRTKFAFPAMCWEKSFIPKPIWQVGDNTSNIIEGIHADANLEGISCTLVGGVKKGLHLDSLKMKTLVNWEQTGIRPTYASGHISESTTRSLKRKSIQHHKTLSRQDTHIEMKNKRLRTAHDAKIKADEQLYTIQNQAGSQVQLERAYKAVDRAADGYVKALTASREVVGSGSGKVGLLLPSHGVPEGTM